MDFMVWILKLFGVGRDGDEGERAAVHRDRRRRAELRRRRDEEIHALMRRRAEERNRWEFFWAIQWAKLIGRMGMVGRALIAQLAMLRQSQRAPQAQRPSRPPPAPVEDQIRIATQRLKASLAPPALRRVNSAEIEQWLDQSARKNGDAKDGPRSLKP